MVTASVNEPVNEDVLEEFAAESATLWLHRDRAVGSHHYEFEDLMVLDERLMAQVDGLLIADRAGREFVEGGCEEAGELFTLGFLAMTAGADESFEMVRAQAAANPRAARGLVSAFGWLGLEVARPWLLRLLAADDPADLELAAKGCRVCGHIPADQLAAWCRSEHPALQSEAARIIGEHKLREHHQALHHIAASPDPESKFWAARSLVLLGGPGPRVLQELREMASSGHQKAPAAAQLYMRAVDLVTATGFYEELRSSSSTTTALSGAIGLGATKIVDDLLGLLAKRKYAQLAGMVLSVFAGIDFEAVELDGEPPEDEEESSEKIDTSPAPVAPPPMEKEDFTWDHPVSELDDVEEDDEDTDVNPVIEDDEDELQAEPEEESWHDLCFPDAERVGGWWQEQRQRFDPNRRYLKGRPTTSASLQKTLTDGTQLERWAAALFLAVETPDMRLFETRAPARRQAKVLLAGHSDRAGGPKPRRRG